jgi:putative glutamine amidotransferase
MNPTGGPSMLAMTPLIGITGEQHVAAQLDGMIEAIRPLQIDVFFADYARAVLRAGGLPVWIPLDTPLEILERLDGLVLSGGVDVASSRYGQAPHPKAETPDLQRDRYELELLGRALEHDLPVLGICRGCQIINVHCGGTLHQYLPAHFDKNQTLDYRLHDVVFTPGSAAHRVFGDRTPVNSLHHQGLDRLGEGVVGVGIVDGGPDDGLIEAIEVTNRRVLGVQWHPELLGGSDPAIEWLIDVCRVSLNS